MYIINYQILLVILEIIIVIIQVDNFSLYYDYNNIKQYYEKLVNDEYRINKLTNFANKLLVKYQKMEYNYLQLLSYNNNNNNLEIEINKYKNIYNICEYKIHKLIKKNKSLNNLDIEINMQDKSPTLLFERSKDIISDIYKSD